MRDIRGEIRDIRAEMATKSDLAALRSELQSEIRDVALDLALIRRELSERIVGLRRAVVEYHAAVVVMVFSTAIWTRVCVASNSI
jgi:hypothetical protein